LARANPSRKAGSIQARPGDVVRVTLKRGGYALAVVLRQDRNIRSPKIQLTGVGRVFDTPPTEVDVHAVKYHHCAVFVVQGDGAIRKGMWPIIGRIPDFSFDSWPAPPERTGSALHVHTDAMDTYVVWPGLFCDEHEWKQFPIATGLGCADAASSLMDVALYDRHWRWYFRVTRPRIATWKEVHGRCSESGLFKRKPGTYKDLYSKYYTEDDPRYPPVD
jgi:hypothetical protein